MAQKVIRCGECGAELDRVEYDPGAGSAQVQTVADALGLSPEQAAEIVKKATGQAPRSQQDEAEALVAQIKSRSVAGRDKASYVCPNGHKDADLVEGDA